MPVSKPTLEEPVEQPWTAYLPRHYVQGQRVRIQVYRRLP